MQHAQYACSPTRIDLRAQNIERYAQEATGLDGWVATLVGGARQGKVGGVRRAHDCTSTEHVYRFANPLADNIRIMRAHTPNHCTRSTMPTSSCTVWGPRGRSSRRRKRQQARSPSLLRCTTGWSTRVRVAAN